MKKYLKEVLVLFIQLLLFYIFPMTAGPTDVMGMVLIIIVMTFVLSFIMGLFSSKKIKYFYPLVCSIIFLPSVFIYYNETAFVHSIWYLVISSIGLIIGGIISTLIRKISK